MNTVLNKSWIIRLKNAHKIRTCDHLKTVWVNENASASYCGYCLPDEKVIEKNYPNYPGDLLTYYELENVPYQKIPPHNPDCDHQFADHPPKITHPTQDATYYIQPEEDKQVLLKANPHNDVEEHLSGISMES